MKRWICASSHRQTIRENGRARRSPPGSKPPWANPYTSRRAGITSVASPTPFSNRVPVIPKRPRQNNKKRTKKNPGARRRPEDHAPTQIARSRCGFRMKPDLARRACRGDAGLSRGAAGRTPRQRIRMDVHLRLRPPVLWENGPAAVRYRRYRFVQCCLESLQGSVRSSRRASADLGRRERWVAPQCQGSRAARCPPGVHVAVHPGTDACRTSLDSARRGLGDIERGVHCRR